MKNYVRSWELVHGRTGDAHTWKNWRSFDPASHTKGCSYEPSSTLTENRMNENILHYQLGGIWINTPCSNTSRGKLNSFFSESEQFMLVEYSHDKNDIRNAGYNVQCCLARVHVLNGGNEVQSGLEAQ
eukprot:scaffold5970_cov130-Cylindrotheca_fusiformis.AAC.2